jgi:hypothetical protein
MGQTRRRSKGGALLSQARKATLRAQAQNTSGKLKPSLSSHVSRKFRMKTLHRPEARKYLGRIIHQIKEDEAENAAYEARQKKEDRRLDMELRRMNRKMRKEEKASTKRFSMKNLFSALPE